MSSGKKPRGVLIAGNWKMNLSPKETESFMSGLGARAAEKLSPGVGAVIFPPAISIPSAQIFIRTLPFPLSIGAQNVHWEKKGAFTGELSGPMLAEIGVKWALVGHSERRQYFAETDETARKRTESLLDQGFRVILCVGETRAERESGQTESVLLRQLAGGLPTDGVARTHLDKTDRSLIIAYEPVWAIGTGLTATPEQAQEAHAVIRRDLAKRFGAEASARTPILYGGSVTPENIDSLLACMDIDGALVGGASIKPESFAALLKSANAAV